MAMQMSDGDLAVLLAEGYASAATPEFSSELLERLQAMLTPRRVRSRRRWLAAALAAALAIACGIGVILHHQPSQAPPTNAGQRVSPPAVSQHAESPGLALARMEALNHSEMASWGRSTIQARSEWIRPLTMSDLLSAQQIAVGRFVIVNGKIDFIVQRMLKGDPAEARKAMLGGLMASRQGTATQPDGKLLFWGVSRGGFSGRSADATKSAVWFCVPGRGSAGVTREPAELADGFAALLSKKAPDPYFRLLQDVDFDMHRDALEEFFAKPEPALVERLHAAVLQPDAAVGLAALSALIQTRLLEADRFWGKWTDLPEASYLYGALASRDAARASEDLRRAVAAAKDPVRLASLLTLIPYGSPDKLALTLPYLDYPSATVRVRVLATIWDTFWNLNDKAFGSPQAEEELAALGKRIVPLLDRRLKVETDASCKARLATMLARKDGVPWLLRIPREQLHEPVPPYSEAAELDFLVNRLTSHGERGFIMRTAGRELAERFFDEGLKRLKAAAAARDIYNTDMVYDGMGYVRDRRMFDYLARHAAVTNIGDSSFSSTLRALGTQDDKRSLATIKRVVASVIAREQGEGWFGNFGIGLVDGLAAVSDKDTLAYLKELQPRFKDHAQVPYLRARAMHGDTWAVGELLAAAIKPAASEFPFDGPWPREDVSVLCFVDTPEATEALKHCVEQPWPSKSDPDGFSTRWAVMENYAGNSRRTSPLGEVARRDPQWLAGLAVRKMADRSLPARCFAADVFAQLTGRLGDYRPDAFAGERVGPLKRIQAWWLVHKGETREQWLISYFKEKGFAMERLDKASLPVLAKALESDFFTHNLAAEQISAICQKYFTGFSHQESYQGRERMTVRIRGWLQARGYLPGE